MPLKVLMFAGEVSGAKHGVNLIHLLRQHIPDLTFFGAGDEAMIQAGLKARYTLADLQVYGLIEVIAHLPRMKKMLDAMEQWAIQEKPDLAILIDYPGFNLRLGERLRKLHIPVILINGPQIWAWREGRIHQIKRGVSRVIVFFPFEAPIYQQAGVDVFFSGHPAVKEPVDKHIIQNLKQEFLLADSYPVIAVLPGSRPGEIQRHWSVLQDSIKQLKLKYPHAKFLVPLVKKLPNHEKKSLAQDGVFIVEKTASELFAVSDLAIVASGTATLEATLSQIPFMIIYKASYVSYWIAKRLAKVQYLGMVNILAKRLIVPELIQHDFHSANIVSEAVNLIENQERRKEMQTALKDVCTQLGQTGAYSRMSENIAEFIRNKVAL